MTITQINANNNMFLVFIISFIICILILTLPKSITTRESDLIGTQKFHFQPTPRIAGIPIFVSFFTNLWYFNIQGIDYLLLLLVSFPVFIVGIVEDVTANVSPQFRLFFTLVSVIVAFFLLDVGVYNLGFEWSDYYLSNYTILSLLFTLLVVSGVVNAVNIIDGYNGLMPGYSIFVLLAISYIASTIGDDLVLQLSLTLVFALIGFFVFNFPFGKIFMGDGGAYFVGFMMAIIGLMLCIRNEEVSHWFLLLLFIYPLYETVFSIYRKIIVRRSSPSQPDGYHLHMLIYKRLIKCKTFKNNKVTCNSMTSPFLWALSLVGIIPAVVWYDNQTMLITWAFVFMVIYTIIYRRIVHFKFKFKK